MSEELVLSAQVGAVLTITLNRPKALNAFTSAMHAELRQALELLPVVQGANSELLRQIQAALEERNELLAKVSAVEAAPTRAVSCAGALDTTSWNASNASAGRSWKART